MNSPFPGMDPYLEPHWLDVHTKLVTYTADQLNRVLPQSLVARTEERVAVETDWDTSRPIGPDVRVFAPSTAAFTNQSATDLGAPFTLVLETDPITERFIRIIDESGQLVTVIEYLSRTNKESGGLEAYREKRNGLVSGGINLLEIDLVRRGDWRALLRPHVCPRAAVAAYRATVRVPPGKTALLYPIAIREPVRSIPVPLRKDDPTVMIPLQELLDQVYINGRYSLTLDYERECDPPLEEGDAAWADELLRAAGKR